MASEIEFFFYANCTSCKKADAFLRAENIPAVRRDFFKHRMSAAEIRALFERAGVTAHEILSTRSKPYQALGLAEKTLTDDEVIELMAEHPQLLRRPLLVSGGETLIGFNSGAYEALAAKLS